MNIGLNCFITTLYYYPEINLFVDEDGYPIYIYDYISPSQVLLFKALGDSDLFEIAPGAAVEILWHVAYD